MLKACGVEYVITGHSERRTYFGDTDVTVQKRTRAALDAGLTVIVCVGEYLEQREQGITDELVAMQTKIALGGVTEEELKRIIIAYEAVSETGCDLSDICFSDSLLTSLLKLRLMFSCFFSLPFFSVSASSRD